MRDLLSLLILVFIILCVYFTYDECKHVSIREDGMKGTVMCVWEGRPREKSEKTLDNSSG